MTKLEISRTRKRKATTQDTTTVSASPKRQKVEDEQSAEATTSTAAPFIQRVRDLQDKNGRSITELFWELPDEKLLPDYYTTIRLPISIALIEAKLARNGYVDITAFEADLRRMIANAKLYNDESSLVYSDAERLRKVLVPWAKDNNPAYKDPNFQCPAAPLPEEKAPAPAPRLKLTATAPVASPAVQRQTISLTSARKTSTSAKPPETASTEPTSEPDSTKAFSQAQWQIIDAMCKVEEYTPFLNKPDRALHDYYRAIKKPTSLNSIKKMTVGKHGHDAETGISDLKTWAAFEAEVALIWTNAQQYNEDGSDIFKLSKEFAKDFTKRVTKAKANVQEPAISTRIKLNARPKTVLHLSSKAGASTREVASPDVLVRGGKLTEDPEHKVQSQTAAKAATPQPVKEKTPIPPSAVPIATTEAPVTAAVPKPEPGKAPTPVRETTRGPSQGSGLEPRIRSTPIPPSVVVAADGLTASPRAPSRQPSAVPPAPQPAKPPTFVETFSRTPSSVEALMSNVLIATHPQLTVSNPLHFNVAPLRDFTHQSLAVMLPPAHHYLQITPSVSQSLARAHQYKLFVTVNNVRVTALTQPRIIPQINGDGLTAMPPVTENKHVYDAQLSPGVNRIEIEIAAASEQDGSLQTEKVSCFANLLQA